MTDPTTYLPIADHAFAPLYPYYAEKIVAATGIRAGVCMDAGCGGGHLGLALVDLTQLHLCLLDKSHEMIEQAKANIVARGMEARARTMWGVVQALPLPAAALDLVVSRGSIPFWSDLPLAFSEIKRVLRPGGHAYLGGGLGTPEMREQIQRTARSLDAGWRGGGHRMIPQHPEGYYEVALQEACIEGFRVLRGDDGTWIHFQKESGAGGRR